MIPLLVTLVAAAAAVVFACLAVSDAHKARQARRRIEESLEEQRRLREQTRTLREARR